jgi:squalene-associated FAD-dependent desaturase
MSRIMPSSRITLLESKRLLGGRAGSYVDPDSGVEVDYCQHAAMGCCTNLIDLLRHCDLEEYFRRYQDLTFLHPHHPPSRFAPSRLLPPPLHLLGTIGAQRYLSRRQKKQIKSGLWKLMRTPPSALGKTRAAQWLADAGQDAETIRNFWDVILVSALGEQTDRVSMAAARKVLIDGFASARGASDVLVPTLPLAELFGRMLADKLISRGVDIQTGTTVRQITPDGNVVTTETQGQADAIICAVPWHQIPKLWDRWPDPQRRRLPDFDSIAKIPASQITGLHLWFDSPITNLDHAVMVGTVAQWVFREPFGSGKPDRIENGSQEHYFQVVISGSADVMTLSKQDLVDTVLAELRIAFPAAQTANLLRYRFVTDPKSVFSISPEVDAIRPPTETMFPWLFLAGDWTQTLWPATMEGAVISGRKAALSALQYATNAGSKDSSYISNTVCPGMTPGFLARFLIRQG